MLRRRHRTEPERAPAVDTYDDVPYPGAAFPQTHPDRLATLARLFGGRPAPVERCRVLELGCGDGGNLIPMAYALPDATFAGIDLNAAAVGRGRARIEALGLENVRLDAGDIAALDPRELGRFDHVIAHGVYSWVPDHVRTALLALCRGCLERDGVAFVSFNALPGGHVRRVLRDAARWAVRDVADPGARIEGARATLRRLAEAEPYDGALGREARKAIDASDALIYHDLLAATNADRSLAEFAAEAAAAGLRYLCDAELDDDGDAAAGAGDRVAREQEQDLVTLRMFRQALVVRDDARAGAEPDPRAVAGLHVRSRLRPPRKLRLEGHAVDEFRGPEGGSLRTDHPLVKAALVALADAWPGSLPFEPLADAAAARLRATRDDATLATALVAAYRRGAVELHAWAPPAAGEAGDRPHASALARLQVAAGEPAVTLRHETVRVDDERGRRLLALLDGTRDRRALAEALALDERAARELPGRLGQLAALGLLLSRPDSRTGGS
jgi:SAM-dependent methyltransferase